MPKKEKIYKVGNWLYLDNSIDPEGHIIGGRAKITAIDYTTNDVKFKGFPAHTFGLVYLLNHQDRWRRKHHWWNRARLKPNNTLINNRIFRNKKMGHPQVGGLPRKEKK